MGVTVSVSGTGAVSRRLRKIEQRAQNVSPAWPRVGSYLSRMARQQFTSEGARLGTPWKPLKPEYRLWKLRHGFGRKILVRSGEMRQGFVGRPMDVEEYGTNTAIFGSNNMKAVWHHNGTHRNGKRVNPPRKILVVTPEIRREVKNILAKHIVGRGK